MKLPSVPALNFELFHQSSRRLESLVGLAQPRVENVLDDSSPSYWNWVERILLSLQIPATNLRDTDVQPPKTSTFSFSISSHPATNKASLTQESTTTSSSFLPQPLFLASLPMTRPLSIFWHGFTDRHSAGQ